MKVVCNNCGNESYTDDSFCVKELQEYVARLEAEKDRYKEVLEMIEADGLSCQWVGRVARTVLSREGAQNEC